MKILTWLKADIKESGKLSGIHLNYENSSHPPLKRHPPFPLMPAAFSNERVVAHIFFVTKGRSMAASE